jgi:hypothetical protein
MRETYGKKTAIKQKAYTAKKRQKAYEGKGKKKT